MAEGGSIELLTLITSLNLSRIFEEPTSAPSKYLKNRFTVDLRGLFRVVPPRVYALAA
jgi:hypothetical protein